MEMMLDFQTFLKARQTPKGGSASTTHRCLAGPLKGAYTIPEHDEPAFVDQYEKLLHVSSAVAPSFTQHPTAVTSARFTFRHRCQTQSIITETAQALLGASKQYAVPGPETPELTAVVLVRCNVPDSEDSAFTSDTQIVLPELRGAKEVFRRLADEVNSTLSHSKRYGVSAAAPTKGWCLLGSSKSKDAVPYVVVGEVTEEDGWVAVHDDVPTLERIHQLTARLYGEGAVATHSLQACSRGGDGDADRPLPSHHEEVMELVELVGTERVRVRYDWLRVGLCLRNLQEEGTEGYLALWRSASRKCAGYVEGGCEREWAQMKPHNRLGMGSLHWWARLDGGERYRSVMLTRLDPLLRLSVGSSIAGNSYDIAQVVRKMFPWEHVCVNIETQRWYSFVDGKWCPSQKGHYLRKALPKEVYQLYCSLAGQLNAEATSDDAALARAKMANDVARRLRTRKFKEDVMRECADLFYDPDFFHKLDTNEQLLGFNDGVYDLDSDVFRLAQPEDYVTLSTRINYVEFAKDAPELRTVESFMSTILPQESVRQYMLRLIASCLDGTIKDHHFHFCTGTGGNGKSVLWDWVESALGDYVQRMPVSLLTNKRAASNSATPELARAAGSRLLIFQEPEDNAVFNTGLMKEMTSDTIVARMLYQDPIEIKPQWKMIMMCNSLPKISSVDGGTWRRVRVVPFESKFVDSPKKPNEYKRVDDIAEQLASCREALVWVLLREYRRAKASTAAPSVPERITLRTNQYRGESDVFRSFVTDMLVEDDQVTTGISELYILFHQYCRENNPSNHIPGRNALDQYLKEHYEDLRKGSRWRLVLNMEEEEDPP